MSTISATRRGFLYQDRFATATYLEQWQSKNIKQFFIDYPLPNQKSIDVRHIDVLDQENVYEVKSGEEFKKDKRKKESSGIRDALINLKEYFDSRNSCLLNLVIRKGFRGNITTYWDHITQVQTHSFSLPQTKTQVTWLFNKLLLPGINSHKELFDFCKIVKVADFADDEPNNGNDPFPDIDDFVMGKITDITKEFNAQVSCVEYPDQILMNDLYHKCRLYAGTGEDVHEIFTSIIIDFITHRVFLDANYTPNSNRGKSRDDIKKEIDKKVNQYLNGNLAANMNSTNADPRLTNEGKTP